MTSKNEKNKETMMAYIFFGVAGILFLLFWSAHIGTVWEQNPSLDIVSAMFRSFNHMSSEPFTLIIGAKFMQSFGMTLVFCFCIAIWIWVDAERERGVLKKDQCGSAKWNTNLKRFAKKYQEKDYFNNMIFSNDLLVSMNTRKTKINNNVCVIGGSGTGKSRFIVKPNILQANCSFVVTDPSGELIESVGGFLAGQGYKVKCYNLINMACSDHYNPFNYIREEEDILKMITCLLENTESSQKKGGDEFWDKCTMLLLSALTSYIINNYPKDKHNFIQIMKMLLMADVDENNPNAKSPLDLLFDAYEKTPEGNNSFAVRQYGLYKKAAGKTAKSILISVASRLVTINIEAVSNILRNDTIDLVSFGDEKTALFVVCSATDSTYSWLISMLYSQLFDSLYYHGDYECKYIVYDKKGNPLKPVKTKEEAQTITERLKKIELFHDEDKGWWIGVLDNDKFNAASKANYRPFITGLSEKSANEKVNAIREGTKVKAQKGQALPIPVRFLLDEFANICQLPNFEKKLATMRKYDISCTIVLQSITQIKSLYEKCWGDLVANCSTLIFLGGQDLETTKYISELLGDTTVRIRNTSYSKSGKGGTNYSYQWQKKRLIAPEEVAGISPSEEIVKMASEKDPFLVNKYAYENHPNYKYTADADNSLKYEFKPKGKALIKSNVINNSKTEIDEEKKKKLIEEGQEEEFNNANSANKQNKRNNSTLSSDDYEDKKPVTISYEEETEEKTDNNELNTGVSVDVDDDIVFTENNDNQSNSNNNDSDENKNDNNADDNVDEISFTSSKK